MNRFFTIALATSCLTACGSMPPARIGCLPFPGILTLYTASDADRLGTHKSAGAPRPADASPECSRGIVYTQRGGFLDIAHIRNTIDWTRYLYLQIKPAIDARKNELVVTSDEGSRVHLLFDYPDDWDSLPDDERKHLANELALLTSQHAVLVMTDWHELLTWFGYRKTIIVSESGSAFSYDDMTSHIVGARVADAALRQPERNFCTAATDALDDELARLGVVSGKTLDKAIHAVRGDWWTLGGFIRKRHLHLNLPGTTLEPWLVPGIASAAKAGAEPERFTVPTLQSVAGRDMTGFMRIEIDPANIPGHFIASRIPGRPRRLIPEDHFPLALGIIRRHILASAGPDALKP